MRARKAPALLRGAVRASAPSLALACVVLFVTPAAVGYVGAVYSPVEIPSEYAAANAYLATTPEDEGVVWMPRALGATTWSGERTMAYFDATSSARAAMGPFRPHTDQYFRFIEDANKDGADVPSLLARAGVQRIVFHNDRDPGRDASKVFALEQTGLVLEERVGDTSVRAVDQASSAPANVPAAKYAINGTRALSQAFTPDLAAPVELTLLAKPLGAPSPLEVRIVDEHGNVTATRRVAAKDGMTEAIVGLRGVALVPGQPYALQLRAGGAGSNASARWEVSYYKLDTYPVGALNVSANVTNATAWRPLPGDLAFEFQSQARGFIDVLLSPEDAPRVRASDAVVVTPGGLQMLRALSALPSNGTLQDAPVVFTAANEAARVALAAEGPFHWVAPLEASEWETLVPFLPRETLVAPFKATTSADGKVGWARGTEGFTYYEYGWSSSLAALKQEAWDLDGDRGIAYTSAQADLDVDINGPAGSVVLARVYEHPLGGKLRVSAGEDLVGVLDTKAPIAGFRWREVGTLSQNASSLRLTGDGSFLGVNLLAVVPPEVLARTQEAGRVRMGEVPYTLMQQAEVVPGLATRVVAFPGVGRFAETNRTTTVAFDAPASGEPALWLRLAKGTPAPLVAIDGSMAARPVCVADCDGDAPWFSAPLGALGSGPHTLTLGPENATARSTIDVIAVTSEPQGLAWQASARVVDVERVDATQYRVKVTGTGPVGLALATPYDAGWVARVGGGAPVRSVTGDSVTNLFLLDTEPGETIVLSYEPQVWAERGVLVTAFALAIALASVAGIAFVRMRRLAAREAPHAWEESA